MWAKKITIIHIHKERPTNYIFIVLVLVIPTTLNFEQKFIAFFYANKASGRLTWQQNDANSYVCVLLALKV